MRPGFWRRGDIPRASTRQSGIRLMPRIWCVSSWSDKQQQQKHIRTSPPAIISKTFLITQRSNYIIFFHDMCLWRVTAKWRREEAREVYFVLLLMLLVTLWSTPLTSLALEFNDFYITTSLKANAKDVSVTCCYHYKYKLSFCEEKKKVTHHAKCVRSFFLRKKNCIYVNQEL